MPSRLGGSLTLTCSEHSQAQLLPLCVETAHPGCSGRWAGWAEPGPRRQSWLLVLTSLPCWFNLWPPALGVVRVPSAASPNPSVAPAALPLSDP